MTGSFRRYFVVIHAPATAMSMKSMKEPAPFLRYAGDVDAVYRRRYSASRQGEENWYFKWLRAGIDDDGPLSSINIAR